MGYFVTNCTENNPEDYYLGAPGKERHIRPGYIYIVKSENINYLDTSQLVTGTMHNKAFLVSL